MNRMLFVLLSLCFVLLTNKVMAQNSPPVPQIATLNQCMHDCSQRFMICLAGTELDISKICEDIPSCHAVSTDSMKTANIICQACAIGVTTNCPGGQKTTPPSQSTTKTPPRPATPADACRALGGTYVNYANATGGPIRVCLTPQGVEQRLEALEQKLNTQLTPEHIAVTRRELAEIMTNLEGRLHNYAKSVDDHFAQLETQLEAINDKVAEHDERLVKLETRPASTGAKNQPGALPTTIIQPVKMGGVSLSLGGFYSQQVYQLYGYALPAVGGEMGVTWPIKKDWNLATDGGFGSGGKYGDLNLYELHARVGVRHHWHWCSLTFGGDFTRRATWSHDDVAATFFGGYLQPRAVFSVGNDGHGIYLYGLLGAGLSHRQHAYVDIVKDKFPDYQFGLGLGWTFEPFKQREDSE